MKFLFTLIVSIITASCEPHSKLVNFYSDVKFRIEPELIQSIDDSISFQTKIVFPPKYFPHAGCLKIVPILYDTLQNSQACFLDTIIIYSDKYKYEGQKINYKKGGTVIGFYKIKYSPYYKFCIVLFNSKLNYGPNFEEIFELELKKVNFPQMN